jgi:hypothetical protein
MSELSLEVDQCACGCKAVERYGPHVRYGQLLQDMYYTLKAVNGGAVPTGGSGMFGKFLNRAMDFLGLSGAVIAAS